MTKLTLHEPAIIETYYLNEYFSLTAQTYIVCGGMDVINQIRFAGKTQYIILATVT